MNKKYRTLLILVVIMMLFSSCSSSNNSDKINIKLNKLKLNEDTKEIISDEFGKVFLNIIKLSIEWHNIYVKNPEDIKVKKIESEISKFIINKNINEFLKDEGFENEELIKKYLMIYMQSLADDDFLKHLNGDKKLNDNDKDIFKEIITIVGQISFITSVDDVYRKEKLLTDEEFEKTKEKKEDNITTLRELLEDIIDKYFDY